MVGESSQVALVPISVSYDSAVELNSYISEQKGVKKVKESLTSFATGTWSAFRRRYGRVWVSFGSSIVMGDNGALPSMREGCSLDARDDVHTALGGAGSSSQTIEPSPLALADLTHLTPNSRLWRRQLVEVSFPTTRFSLLSGPTMRSLCLLIALSWLLDLEPFDARRRWVRKPLTAFVGARWSPRRRSWQQCCRAQVFLCPGCACALWTMRPHRGRRRSSAA